MFDRRPPSRSGFRLLGRRGRGQEAPYLADDALGGLDILERDHEELVALLDADDAVAEEPDGVEDGVAAEEPTDGRADDGAGLKDLREDGDARRAAERPEQGRADVAHHLALELDPAAVGLVQLARRDEALALAQVVVELLTDLAHGPDGQRRVREPVRVRAEEEPVEAGEGGARAHARGERERDDDGLLRVLPRPVVGAVEPRGRGRRQARRADAEPGEARAHARGARRALVILPRAADEVFGALAGLLPG